MSYTALAVAGVLGALVLDLVVLRTGLVRRRAFWTAYAIVLLFQLLTNGWLTGRDIVVQVRVAAPRPEAIPEAEDQVPPGGVGSPAPLVGAVAA